MSTTAAYKDGDCRVMLNLRKKNGVLRPVTPRKEVRTLDYTYDYMFQHNLPQTGENLLGVRTTAAPSPRLYWIKPDNSEVELAIINDTLVSMTQIGNIVNVLDSGGMRHVWWTDGEYKVFNNSFEGAQGDTIVGPIKVDLKVEGIMHPTTGNQLQRIYHGEYNFSYGNRSESQTAEAKKARVDVAIGLTNKAVTLEQERGNLIGFFFGMPVLELYDGSFISLSSPVLLGQAYDTHTRYSNIAVDGTIIDYQNNKGVWYGEYSGYAINNIQDQSSDIGYTNTKVYKNNGNFNNGVNTAIKPSLLCSFMNTINSAFGGRPIVCVVSMNKLQFRLDNNIQQQYSQLIKSVSIFISPEINMYNTSEGQVNAEVFMGDSSGEDVYYESLSCKPKTNTEILKELSENQQFYKVHEISFDELQSITPGTWIDIDLKGKIGESLKYQDELPVGSTHTTVPYAQLAYNAKLHALGYKSELFRPWPLLYYHGNPGIGQFDGSNNTTGLFYWIKVSIKTETGTSEVVRYKPYMGNQTINLQQNMFSYPDSRAFKMEIYIWNVVGFSAGYGYVSHKTYNLTPSETHNFAYYIDPDLKPIAFGWSEGNIGNTTIPTEANRTQYYRNAIKVSLGNNPFYFPSEAVMTVGTGNILTGGANAMQMSEGQFGQYDLYILTDEGIYSLDTGTTINYNRISPASLEVPTSNIICNTPHGLVFVGRKGAYILAGASPIHISDAIEEAATYTKVGAIDYDFNEFLKTLSDIVYNPFEREIIFVGADDYHYVFHVDSKAWYISTEPISIEVKNAQPQLLVAVNDKIKSYNDSQSNMAQVGFELRPMYFGIDEVKKMQKAVIRGQFKYLNTDVFSNEPFLSIYGSRDAIEQKMLRGWKIPSNLQGRNYKDFDSGMMAKTSFRSYIIAMKAEVDEKSSIEYIDFEISDPLNNDKLR